MDEERLVRDILAQPQAPHPDTVADARAKLDRLARNDVRHASRSSGRLRIAITVAVAAAGVVVGASLVPNLIPSRDEQPRELAPAHTAPASPHTYERPAKKTPTAGELLSLAAESEAAHVKPAGPFWRLGVLSVSRVMVDNATKPYTVEIHAGTEYWGSPRADDDAITEGFLTLAVRPPTKADREAYKKDGSPTVWKLPAGATDKPMPGRAYRIPDDGTMRSVTDGLDWLPYELAGLDSQRLRKLPTEPKKLAEVLWGMRHKKVTDDRNSWLFAVLGRLLVDSPIQPGVRTAAWKALAQLPGVSVSGTATDVLGRSGLAVEDKGSKVQLVLEPDTGRLLGLQPPGKPTHYVRTAVVFAGWTDDKPRPPQEESFTAK